MTGAILAGGLSRRMGFNKAFIKLNHETIIERSVRLFKGLFDETLVVTSTAVPYELLSTRVVTDIYKGAGSLGGIYTALFHSPGEYVFVAACDMPGLDPGAISAVLKAQKTSNDTAKGGFDAFIPFINDRYHPMHALYSKRCMKPIEAMIKQGDLKISNLIEKIRVKPLVEDDLEGAPIAASIENINTREELERISEGARQEGGDGG
jgi:molybdopterin-guanine dinucleotide biosynthesis protein A